MIGFPASQISSRKSSFIPEIKLHPRNAVSSALVFRIAGKAAAPVGSFSFERYISWLQ
jgi:hypothetical protein